MTPPDLAVLPAIQHFRHRLVVEIAEDHFALVVQAAE
jgi:hypothetical protein